MDREKPALNLMYRGSVKDILGPIATRLGSAVVFDYSDAYSVFDWGRMPDAIAHKGCALAVTAADFFERLEQPSSWKEFSRSAQALGLRRNNPFGVDLIEVGERLQELGLRTHYWGAGVGGTPLSECQGVPPRQLLVRQVAVGRPRSVNLLGREVFDYSATWGVTPPKLVPLEIVFRFSTPTGSSLLERLTRDPRYLEIRGFPGLSVPMLENGSKIDFPILELFTKLEPIDRPLTLEEAVSICGCSVESLREIFYRTAWVSAFLRWRFAQLDIELADGKLEWAVDSSGHPLLVDAIGPDELRLLHGTVHLSKEFLRSWYRGTEWYQLVQTAKEKSSGSVVQWKRGLAPPPRLPEQHLNLASQMYRSLANRLTEREWFPETWSLAQVFSALRDLQPREVRS